MSGLATAYINKSLHKYQRFSIGSAAAVVAWWLECWTGDPGVLGSNPPGTFPKCPFRVCFLRSRESLEWLSIMFFGGMESRLATNCSS